MDALFIDTFFDPTNSRELERFQHYTEKLWNFVDTAEPFECKDIKTALTELMEAQQNLEDLQDKLDDANEKLEEKAGRSRFLLGKNGKKYHYFITFQWKFASCGHSVSTRRNLEGLA